MSLLTFKGINMIFHAKTKEFLCDFQFGAENIPTGDLQRGGREVAKILPSTGIQAYCFTHMKPLREQVKIGYELAQVC